MKFVSQLTEVPEIQKLTLLYIRLGLKEILKPIPEGNTINCLQSLIIKFTTLQNVTLINIVLNGRTARDLAYAYFKL